MYVFIYIRTYIFIDTYGYTQKTHMYIQYIST